MGARARHLHAGSGPHDAAGPGTPVHQHAAVWRGTCVLVVTALALVVALRVTGAVMGRPISLAGWSRGVDRRAQRLTGPPVELAATAEAVLMPPPRRARSPYAPDGNWSASVGGPTQSVCMVVRTFVGQRNALVALLASALSSRHPSLHVILVDTGKAQPFHALAGVAGLVNGMAGREAVHVSRWTYHTSRARYPALTVEDYGYVATDLALEDAMYGHWPVGRDGAPRFACDTFVVTNGDNLYTAEWFRATARSIAQGYDLVATNWVSHYAWDSSVWDARTAEQLIAGAPHECGSMRAGADMEMWAADDLHINCIDLGAVLFKRWIMDATGARFCLEALAENATVMVTTGGRAPVTRKFEFFTADGWFFQRAHKAPGARTRVLRRALMVHQ